MICLLVYKASRSFRVIINVHVHDDADDLCDDRKAFEHEHLLKTEGPGGLPISIS